MAVAPASRAVQASPAQCPQLGLTGCARAESHIVLFGLACWGVWLAFFVWLSFVLF